MTITGKTFPESLERTNVPKFYSESQIHLLTTRAS